MIRQCCQCKKIEVNGQWVQPGTGQLEGRDVSHGYCNVCLEAFKKSFRGHTHISVNWRRWTPSH